MVSHLLHTLRSIVTTLIHAKAILRGITKTFTWQDGAAVLVAKPHYINQGLNRTSRDTYIMEHSFELILNKYFLPESPPRPTPTTHNYPHNEVPCYPARIHPSPSCRLRLLQSKWTEWRLCLDILVL